MGFLIMGLNGVPANNMQLKSRYYSTGHQQPTSREFKAIIGMSTKLHFGQPRLDCDYSPFKAML